MKLTEALQKCNEKKSSSSDGNSGGVSTATTTSSSGVGSSSSELEEEEEGSALAKTTTPTATTVSTKTTTTVPAAVAAKPKRKQPFSMVDYQERDAYQEETTKKQEGGEVNMDLEGEAGDGSDTKTLTPLVAAKKPKIEGAAVVESLF